jgi:glycosyltransferase involved in cell wall biosynthesis
MQVYISFNTSHTISGGGRNFLLVLENFLKLRNELINKPSQADIILINSHHNILKNIILKFLYPRKLFVHRIDGRVSMHRGNSKWDELIKIQNYYLANANIYQSNWSRKIWESDLKGKKSQVIFNSPNRSIFTMKKSYQLHNPIKVAYFSWSKNPKKGFNFVKWLKTNEKKYSVEVVYLGGNELVWQHGENNSHRLNQIELANALRKCDLFLSPAEDESCSNAILEAQAIGLPVIALNSGGNPELIAHGKGEIFNSEKDFIKKIKKISKNYDYYVSNLKKYNKNDDNLANYLIYFNSLLDEHKPNYNVMAIRLHLLKAASMIVILKLKLFLNIK